MPNLVKPIGELFPTKHAVYEWLFNTYKATIRDYQRHGWWEFQTANGNYVEGTNEWGYTFNELIEHFGLSYEIPIFGSRSPDEILF